MSTRRRAILPYLLALALVWSSPPAPAATAQEPAAEPVVVRTLSNRPDLLSGGGALVEVVLPAGADPAGVMVTAGSADLTDAFAVRADGRLLGLVRGLPLGETDLTATLPNGSGATLTVTMHPVGGPIFAGPQVTPWPCDTEANGLGAPLDEQCNVEAPIHEFFYRPTNGNGFQAYDPENPANNVATTTTDEGQEVPYIVRRERGVINRAMYDVAVLYDPAQPDWDRWNPQEGWNHKVHWTFGGSCQPYHGQQAPDSRPDGGAPGVLDDRALSRGMMVATSAMHTLGNNCNTVVSAETMMMMQEHIIESYGDVRFFFGLGASGGSLQQIQIADAYPGLLDGIIPQSTFADIVTTAVENIDCRTLVHYFNGDGAALGWTATQQAAVQAGIGGTPATCRAWVNVYGFPAMLADPTLGCRTPLLTYVEVDPAGIQRRFEEPDWVYHPTDNPAGARCTVWDYAAAIFGTDPDTGFANRPYDNHGVLYGLEALRAGLILPEQFVHLNEHVGSLDVDYQFVDDRAVASAEAMRRAHASGQVTSGRWLRDIPILDASYPAPHGDHTAFHAFSLHERILAAGGGDDTHIIRQVNDGRALFVVMDEWLTNLEADVDAGTDEERVIRNKPADATQSGEWAGADPRIGAGAPLRDDIVKCQLQPLADADLGPLPFTDEQTARLAEVFPSGVCDHSLPGIGAAETIPWATYAGGDGPVPLGPAPESVPFGPAAPEPPAPGPATAERFGGSDRFATAVQIAANDAVDTVVLARGDDPADALAGGPLAQALGAALLLTRSSALPDVVAAEIQRLGATTAVLLGGTAAISDDVAETLRAMGLTVDRVAGPTRYGTAAGIAGRLDGAVAAVLANGERFPDALGATTLAASGGVAPGPPAPLVLTRADDLPDETRAALGSAWPVTIVGGASAVGPDVEQALRDAGHGTARLAGADRFATAAAVADALAQRAADAPSTVWIATGGDFADGLLAGLAAARDGGVLLLVDPAQTRLPAATADWLSAHAGSITTVKVAGGPVAVPEALVDAVLGTLSD